MTTNTDQKDTPPDKRPRGRPRVAVRALPQTETLSYRIPLTLDSKLTFVCQLDSVGRSEFARRALEAAIAKRLKEVE